MIKKAIFKAKRCIHKRNIMKQYHSLEYYKDSMRPEEYHKQLQANAPKFPTYQKMDFFLKNPDDLELYKEFTSNPKWRSTFEAVDLFNLIDRKSKICMVYCEQPDRVMNHLKLINLNDPQRHCLYHFLIQKGKQELRFVDEDEVEIEPFDNEFDTFQLLQNLIDMVTIEYNILGKKINEEDYKYNFENVKKQLETLNNSHNKITFLIEQKALYQQDHNKPKNTPSPNFEEKCNIEIEKIKTLAEFEVKQTEITEVNLNAFDFQLSSKLSKIDFIRILNIMYEMKMFEQKDGQIPTKDKFIKTVGSYFNSDLSHFQKSISGSLQNQSLEVNKKVFEDMIKKVEKIYSGKNNIDSI